MSEMNATALTGAAGSAYQSIYGNQVAVHRINHQRAQHNNGKWIKKRSACPMQATRVRTVRTGGKRCQDAE